jgi:hypothetical protein
MYKFTCEKCKKNFPQKSAYASHLLRLNPCVKDNTIINECEYCKNLYSTKYKLRNHLNICKEKKSYDLNQSQLEELKKMFECKLEEQLKRIEEQQKDNEQLKKKVEELSHVSETNNNININENSHNVTNNTINIYSSGKEDLSILSKEDIIRLCTSGTYYPIVAVEILHCNDKYPEFQNVLISNLRASTGLVKINDKWETKSHDELLTNIMRVDKKHISLLMKDLEVDKRLQIKLESTQNEIDTNEAKEHHKNKIKRRLYDASKMIKKNKDKSVV